ncbi:hypothetical protein [Streptomyces bacillaris]|uniref:hypothetical protein n=1 Tax=Streptomyces bacillaris TaxID=68179 RepID=UPI0034671DB4
MTEQPLPPAVREVITALVDAVRTGDDARIDRLLNELVRIGSPEALYELRTVL